MSATRIITADSENAGPSSAAGYPFRRLMFWNMRRELWENRSIIIAPFAAGAVLVLAILIPSLIFAERYARNSDRIGVNVSGPKELTAFGMAYMIPAAPVLAIGVVVAVAYCLGALYNERRDRSILFWKSLPVSDLVTVLSKASIPILLMPLISFMAAMVTQLATFAMILTAGALSGANGHFVWGSVHVDSRAAMDLIWAGTPIGYITLGMLYGVLATALWHAPIYAWLLLVGGWARRMAFVWAVAPVGGLMIVEWTAFGTHRLETMFLDRLYGSAFTAFAGVTSGNLPDLTPGRFLSDPGLWIGVAVAALFLGAAIRLRRYRQPI